MTWYINVIKVKINRKETYFIINGKQCPPGKYSVYEGSKIAFVVKLTAKATVEIYDKLSKKVLFKAEGTEVKGYIVADNDMQLEVRAVANGRILDRYG